MLLNDYFDATIRTNAETLVMESHGILKSSQSRNPLIGFD